MKVSVVFKLLINLFNNSTEFIKNYMISSLLGYLVFIFIIIYYFITSIYLLKIILFSFLLVLMYHIKLGFNSILKDYIYNKSVVYFCYGIVNLILVRLFLEVIILLV